MISNSLTPNSWRRNRTTEPRENLRGHLLQVKISHGQRPSLALHESILFDINFQVPMQATTAFALLICAAESEIYIFFSR